MQRTARAHMPQRHDPLEGPYLISRVQKVVVGGLSLCMAGNRSPVLDRWKAYEEWLEPLKLGLANSPDDL